MGERVISEQAARQLTYMMTQVIERGTGGRARLDGHQAAGKTGTTQAARDAWFIGFTGDYVTGVWMGNDDNSPLTGVTGGGLPAEIWHEVMARVEEGQPDIALPVITPDQMPPPQYPGQTYASEEPIYGGTATAAPYGAEPAPQRDNTAEQIIIDVLGRLFGGRN